MASCGAAGQADRTRGGGHAPSLCTAVQECFVDHVRKDWLWPAVFGDERPIRIPGSPSHWR